MRAVLVSLPERSAKGRTLAFSREALGLGYLAAAARSELGAAVSVTIIDVPLLGLSPPTVVRQVGAHRPQVVGVSIPCLAGVDHGLETVRAIKKRLPDSFVVLGGHALAHTAHRVLETTRCADAVVLGEGEAAFVALLKALTGGGRLDDVPNLVWRSAQGTVQNEIGPLVPNLDALPFPARDNLAWALGAGMPTVTLSASRGCYGDCAFCSVSTFYRLSPGPKWRARSPENVVEEIKCLSRDFGATRFSFVDDNFVGPGSLGRAHAEALAHAIRRLRPRVSFSIACRASDVDQDLFGLLAEAGMRAVFLGVESLNGDMLQRMGKRVSRSQNQRALRTVLDLGTFLEVGYISYDPDCTLEEVENSYRSLLATLGDHLDVTSGLNQRVVAFPGTPLAKRLSESGRLIRKDRFNLGYELADPRVAWLERCLSPFIKRLDTLRAKLSVQISQSEPSDARARLRLAGIRRLLCRYYETLIMEGCSMAALAPDARLQGARMLRRKLKRSLADLESRVASGGR